MAAAMTMLLVFVWLLLGRFVIGWLRWSTRLPIPGREQDVREEMNRGRQLWTP